MINDPASDETLKRTAAASLEKYKAELEVARQGVTHNYVLFDDKLVSILKKFGLAGLIGGGYKHFTSGGSNETPSQ